MDNKDTSIKPSVHATNSYLADNVAVLANLTWKELETIYYLSIPSLQDYAKTLPEHTESSTVTDISTSSIPLEQSSEVETHDLPVIDTPATIPPKPQIETIPPNTTRSRIPALKIAQSIKEYVNVFPVSPFAKLKSTVSNLEQSAKSSPLIEKEQSPPAQVTEVAWFVDPGHTHDELPVSETIAEPVAEPVLEAVSEQPVLAPVLEPILTPPPITAAPPASVANSIDLSALASEIMANLLPKPLVELVPEPIQAESILTQPVTPSAPAIPETPAIPTTPVIQSPPIIPATPVIPAAPPLLPPPLPEPPITHLDESKGLSQKPTVPDTNVPTDELRNLIRNHIKHAADQISDTVASQSISSGREYEVWINNPSRSKFVGGAKETQLTANNTAPFKPRIVPPEIRKSCLMLGLRPEDLSYQTVQEAWKKSIALPGVHPDQGGDTELAVYLNTAKDILTRWLDVQAPKLGKQFGSGKKEPPPEKEKGKNKL